MIESDRQTDTKKESDRQTDNERIRQAVPGGASCHRRRVGDPAVCLAASESVPVGTKERPDTIIMQREPAIITEQQVHDTIAGTGRYKTTLHAGS